MASFWEKISVNGAEMDMYASVPSSSAGFSAPYPAVLVAQHATGVDEFIQDICDRLAAEGYAAVAPNLYHRHSEEAIAASANGGPRPSPGALLSDPDIVADINAAMDWLLNHDAVQSDRIGVTGFCMGGRVAWLAAASNPNFKAVVPYYGGNLMTTWGAGQTPPFDLADDINCPMLFHFGEIDANPSQDDMQKLDAELSRLGKDHTFHTYPDADHAFMNPAGGRYNEAAAVASWPRTLEFFAQHLNG
ncbi:MAG: dienelactone hydrolase family protein [Chloroflexota bacterium]|nr:dienelactone hydrolase family protein [Chloroflexota bacterium]MDE2683277.1 dienelactone hydrolase family protein [Chloroflexota bacterium]